MNKEKYSKFIYGSIFTSILASLLLIFAFTNSESLPQYAAQPKSSAKIEVIQFHSENRCATCLKIEKYARATVAKNFPDFPFRLVNVDDKQNEKFAEQFEAAGTALFLYNPTNGKKKDLTDFAFMKVGDEKKFTAELKKSIEDFLKK